MFYLLMGLALLSTYFARNLQRTRIGRAFAAIRDNDLAAEIMGIKVFRYKLLAFFLCSLYAGLAGALYAVWARGVSVEHYDLHESIWQLGMLIIGGMGSASGVWFGVIFIRGLDVLVRYLGLWISPLFEADLGAAIAFGSGPIIFGIIGLVFLVFEPKGLYRIWERFKAYYRLWPFSF
jgi:branched-chain amino acid transport system permease protein